MKEKYFTLVIIILLTGCVSSYHYKYNHPLSSEFVTSKDGKLIAFIPKGWFAPNDSSQISNYIFLLIKNDYSCSITLEKIFIDGKSRTLIEQKGLELLAQISLELRKETSKDFVLSRKPEFFQMNNKNYCAYEYYSDWTSKKIRVIVFELNGDYYECSAIPLNGVWLEKDLIELYTAAQTFLHSLNTFSGI